MASLSHSAGARLLTPLIWKPRQGCCDGQGSKAFPQNNRLSRGCEIFLAGSHESFPSVFCFQVLGANYEHEYLVDHPFSHPAGSCGNFVFSFFPWICPFKSRCKDWQLRRKVHQILLKTLFQLFPPSYIRTLVLNLWVVTQKRVVDPFWMGPGQLVQKKDIGHLTRIWCWTCLLFWKARKLPFVDAHFEFVLRVGKMAKQKYDLG